MNIHLEKAQQLLETVEEDVSICWDLLAMIKSGVHKEITLEQPVVVYCAGIDTEKESA